ncbi:MAG TPA: DegQ family serine endoprotease [Chlamydiales bacterium]|nr:DegQ family serine endoprotease [Chlamydiales bacterium]
MTIFSSSIKKALSISFFALIIPLASHANANISYLEKTSKAFTAIGKNAMPAAVYIQASYDTSQVAGSHGSQGQPYHSPNDFFEEFRRFFGEAPSENTPQRQQIASGSGFIISSDGYIITNNHVIQNANEITVTTNNGKEYPAKLIGSDPRTDIAVIKVDETDLPYLKFGNSNTLEIGEWVIAIGSPFQLQSTLTVGVVSAKGRNNLRITDYEDFIQTDAAINPGNSGGPLLNLKGEVIGINTAIASTSGGYLGIGFAIPSNMAKHVIEQIIKNGTVSRGHLGIYLQSIDTEMAEALGLSDTNGALVAEVIKDSPAEKEGLKQGDVIIEYNGQKVKNMASFRNDMALLQPGDKVELTVLRGDKKKQLTITLGASPKEKLITKQTNALGIEVAIPKDLSPRILNSYAIDPETKGVVITSVKIGSIAHKAGLKPGMVILKINQKEILTPDDFQESLKDVEKKKHILLLVKQQNVTHFITIRMQQ